MLQPSWCVRVPVKIAKCNFALRYHQRSTPNRSPMNCLLRIHNSSILETSVGKNTSFFNTQPVSKYRCYVRVMKHMYKKTYLSFRFITSRPLCQIKRRDQTTLFNYLRFLNSIVNLLNLTILIFDTVSSICTRNSSHNLL